MRSAKRMPIFAALLIILSCATGQAQTQVTGNMAASVSVNSIFTMTTSQPSLNFGNVNPGPITTSIKDLYLFCQSNNNNLWELSINLLAPLTSGGSTIPNENFNWWGWTTNGSGMWSAGTGNLDLAGHTFYSAGINEWITSAPSEFTLQFNIDVPQNQPVGIYTTSIVVKMRDTATSQEVEQIVYVAVGVNPSFFMSVNPTSLNFSNAASGATTDTEKLYIACSTNNNAPWRVSMSVIAPLTSGTYIIPNEVFKWSGSSLGSGMFYPGTGYLSTVPFIFYEAGAGEYVTSSPIELFLNFYVEIPPNQIAGTYTTTLVLTMTE